jgi:hypothetical protein
MTKPEIRIYTGDGQFIDREMNDQEYESSPLRAPWHYCR